MGGKFWDFYRREWPRVGAVQAMALGGASLFASRKRQTSLRALAVMNSMTMAAHQVEEYVEPGYFAGQVNRGLFRSDQPRNYPFNAQSAMCANTSFTAIYIPPLLFPKVKWLALPPVIVGITQAFGHGLVLPIAARARYSPGFLTAFFLHVPIGIAYLHTLRAQEGPIERSDWIRTLGVLAAFAVLGVATPNVLGADRDSPYPFTAKQMGPYDIEASDRVEGETEPAREDDG